MNCDKQYLLDNFFSNIDKLIIQTELKKSFDLNDIIIFINNNLNNENINQIIRELLECINCDTIDDNDKEEDIKTLFKEHDKLSCFLINKLVKKEKYYIYTYTYTPLLDETYNLVEKTNFSNCCNCISFILYSIKLSIKNINWLTGVFIVLYLSLNNIERYLDNLFIARIYLDISIFRHIFIFYQKFHNNIKYQFHARLLLGLLLKIINHDVSEIYIYFCKDYNDINDGRKRMYRFLPFLQSDTNVCISWDVDNLITHNICLYFKKFYEDKSTLFFMNLIKDGILSNVPYNGALIQYATLRNDGKHFINLLAGCFGLKIKLDEKIFYDSINTISNKFMKDKDNLWYAFDEILLYELFSSITIDNSKKELFFFIKQSGDGDKFFPKSDNDPELLNFNEKFNYLPKIYDNDNEEFIDNPIISHFKFEYYLNLQMSEPIYDIDEDSKIKQEYRESKSCYNLFERNDICNISNYTHALINKYFKLNISADSVSDEDIELNEKILLYYENPEKEKLKITSQTKFERYLSSIDNLNKFINIIYENSSSEITITRLKYLKYKKNILIKSY